MDAKLLKVGMKVRNGKTIVEVTSVPKLDSYGECFFSGKIISTEDPFFHDKIGNTYHNDWNSAFSYPI